MFGWIKSKILRLEDTVRSIEERVNYNENAAFTNYLSASSEIQDLRREFYEYRHRNPNFKAGDKVWFDNSPYPAWVGEGGAVHHLGGQGIKQCTVTLVSETSNGWRVHDPHNHEYFDAKHSELFPPQKADGSFATADSDEEKRKDVDWGDYPYPQIGERVVGVPRKGRIPDWSQPNGTTITGVMRDGRVQVEGGTLLYPGEYVVAEGEQS